MSVGRYTGIMMQWGAEQDLAIDPTSVPLAATGAGVWAAVDGQESQRAGDWVFQAGVEHALWAGLWIGPTGYASSLPFPRLRDGDSGLILVTLACAYETSFHHEETFENLPASNAPIFLEYQLTNGIADFFCAAWQFWRAP